MTTAPIKKAVASVKAQVVPTKAIANAASKVSVVKAAVKAAVKAKPAAKPAAKPVAKAPAAKVIKPAMPVKAAAKPAAKKPVKVAAKPVVAKPVAPTASIAEPAKEKVKKAKLVRDSFTMPEAEYAVLSHVKKACLSAGIEAKKSQLLRVGLLLLSKTDVSSLKTLIANLEPLKAGRPKKDK